MSVYEILEKAWSEQAREAAAAARKHSATIPANASAEAVEHHARYGHLPSGTVVARSGLGTVETYHESSAEGKKLKYVARTKGSKKIGTFNTPSNARDAVQRGDPDTWAGSSAGAPRKPTTWTEVKVG